MKQTGGTAGGTVKHEPETTVTKTAERAVTLGCMTLIACVVLSCSLSAIFRPSDLVEMRACADACGPGRMEEFTSTRCDCIDGPTRLTEPMIPVDAGASDQ